MLRHVWLGCLYLSAAFAADFADFADWDYCKKSSCGQEHVACQNSKLIPENTFGKRCRKRTRVLNLDKVQNEILHYHNHVRNVIAGGYQELPIAAHMTELAWDEELAFLALLNVKKCSSKYDRCRETQNFDHPGQNVHRYKRHTYRPISATSVVESIMINWQKDLKYLNNKIIKKYPAKSNSEIHYIANMVNDRNTHVGCAAVIEPGKRSSNVHFTCNYSASPKKGRRLYAEGSEPGSECRTKSENYNSLCQLNEADENAREEFDSVESKVKQALPTTLNATVAANEKVEAKQDEQVER